MCVPDYMAAFPYHGVPEVERRQFSFSPMFQKGLLPGHWNRFHKNDDWWCDIAKLATQNISIAPFRSIKSEEAQLIHDVNWDDSR